MVDYVVATDQSCRVRDFVQEVYRQLGFAELQWEGVGVNEKLVGKLQKLKSDDAVRGECGENIVLVEVNQALFRPGEVPYLRGDTTKINNDFNWSAKTSCQELTTEMIHYNQELLLLPDLNYARSKL